MFMRIVMQVLGQIMDRFIVAYMLTKEHLFKLVNSLRVSCTQVFPSADTIRNQVAKAKQSINHLVAQFTNQVLLIKVGLINVATKVGQLGQQLVTIARKIHQRVLNLLKRGN
jgi:hypothetical protein